MAPVAVIIGALATWGPSIWKALSAVGNIGSAVAVAVVTAVPPTLSAIFDGLDKIAKSALLSFLFGAVLAGIGGFAFGLSFDAPARERAERRAIAAANARADTAIERIRAEHAEKLAAALKQKRR